MGVLLLVAGVAGGLAPGLRDAVLLRSALLGVVVLRRGGLLGDLGHNGLGVCCGGGCCCIGRGGGLLALLLAAAAPEEEDHGGDEEDADRDADGRADDAP